MRKTVKGTFRLAVVVAALATTGLVAAPANAGVVYNGSDNSTKDVYVPAYGTSMHLWSQIDSSHKQSHATMNAPGAGVNSRALCSRDNGGTQWYQSTIRSLYLGGDSHYDCDNNGTYNHAIVANGGYMS